MRRFLLLPFLLPVLLFAAQSSPTQNLSPNDLVRKVVNHELEAGSQDHTQWMYTQVTNKPAPAKTQTVIETVGGELSCLDRIDGRPLTPEERNKEDQRLQKFIADPSLQRKARRDAEADDKKTRDLFAMLPDAFLFKVAEESGDTAKLTFTPNPAFHPSSSQASVFHKMGGFVVVNTKENRLVQIAGTLNSRVEFGGGLLGHLDRGGTFHVERQQVAPSHWAVTRIRVNMNGKALFFKTISVQQDETDSDFHQVPTGTTLAQAESLLRKPAEQKGTE